jgi:hypothetical protein
LRMLDTCWRFIVWKGVDLALERMPWLTPIIGMSTCRWLLCEV